MSAGRDARWAAEDVRLPAATPNPAVPEVSSPAAAPRSTSSPAPTLGEDTGVLQRSLLAWARAAGRDLPWRRTRDPWAVLVSELMLQQTQVARVVPRYEAFLARFPTPAACAGAPAGDVIRLWAGLGYNRRALHLHGAAAAAVARHGGRLPGTLSALLRLPGVGRVHRPRRARLRV